MEPPQIQDLILENEYLRVVFDPQTGALTYLANPTTGWVIQQRAELAQSYRMVVPLPERLLNVVNGRKQQLARVVVGDGGQSIHFSWNGLQSEHGGWLDINLQAVVSLTDAGLHFSMEIQNHSPYPVESCAYPYLGELCPPSTSHSLTRANIAYDHLTQKPLYPQFPNERGYWGTEYPIQMVATPETLFLLVLANDNAPANKQGLYIGCHDTSSAERIEFTFRLIPGYGKVGYVPEDAEIVGQPVRLDCYTEHLPFVQPGETRRLLPVVLKPFFGGWQAGADIYKSWRSTWMHKPYEPAWLNEVHAWQQVQMTSWGDTLNIRYEDLLSYAQECAANDVRAIQLVGWTLYGQDGRLPIHETDPRLGNRADLKRAIEAIQALGVRVILYEKYTCADISTDSYRETLHHLTSKDIFGNTHGHEGWRYDTPAHLAGINTRPYAWMCMNQSTWQDIAIAEIRKSLELNPDGILLDESMWHGSNGFYCFDPDHEHPIPAYNFGGDEVFEKKLVKLLAEYQRGLLLAGEGPYDLQNRHYALSYHRAGEGHIPVMRYIDPYLPMMNWVYGFDDRESINLCLLYRYIISYEPRHFRGRLHEFPKTLAYGKQVDFLRRKYRAYLWDAEFRDTLSASITVNEQPHRLYSVFQQAGTNRRAIVIANHDPNSEITANVVTDDNPGSFVLVSPEEPEPARVGKTIHIHPRSVVVLLEQ